MAPGLGRSSSGLSLERLWCMGSPVLLTADSLVGLVWRNTHSHIIAHQPPRHTTHIQVQSNMYYNNVLFRAQTQTQALNTTTTTTIKTKMGPAQRCPIKHSRTPNRRVNRKTRFICFTSTPPKSSGERGRGVGPSIRVWILMQIPQLPTVMNGVRSGILY